jgi:hypothetical protein
MNNAQAFRLQKEYTHKVAAPPSKIFPLLCPVLEYDWIEDWSCEMIHSKSGVAEYGCVFKTHLARVGGMEQVWEVSRYEPEAGVIQFVVTNQESHVMKLDIGLTDCGDGATSVHWSHTFTALTDQGRAFVQSVEHIYEGMMIGLEESLSHYCRTGKMLRKAQVPAPAPTAFDAA